MIYELLDFEVGGKSDCYDQSLETNFVLRMSYYFHRVH